MEKIMKKYNVCKKVVAVLALTLLISGGATAAMASGHNKSGGFSGPNAQGGGFSGPGPAVTTIMEASKKADDTWVTLQGNIVQGNGDDKYTFRDASGTGIVEIENDAWNGQHIGPNDTVKLITKVDKDWGHTELEVKQVHKAH